MCNDSCLKFTSSSDIRLNVYHEPAQYLVNLPTKFRLRYHRH